MSKIQSLMARAALVFVISGPQKAVYFGNVEQGDKDRIDRIVRAAGRINGSLASSIAEFMSNFEFCKLLLVASNRSMMVCQNSV